VHKSSGSFVYANGFLRLTVVFMPFPTALVGEYLMTNHVAPAFPLTIAIVTTMLWVYWLTFSLRAD
jgi:uncharacterized membrane protein